MKNSKRLVSVTKSLKEAKAEIIELFNLEDADHERLEELLKELTDNAILWAAFSIADGAKNPYDRP